jgi:hypothetical protein
MTQSGRKNFAADSDASDVSIPVRQSWHAAGSGPSGRVIRWCSVLIQHGRSLLTRLAGPPRYYCVGAGIGRMLDTFHPVGILTST